MRGSTFLPWLFFGPLIGALTAYPLWTFTGWAWAKQVSIGALLLLGFVVPVLAATHWWHYRKTAATSSENTENEIETGER